MTAIATAESMDGGSAVRLVRSTLSGPVLGLLREMMPELSSVPSDSAYDRVMGSIYLLTRSFKAFRDRRERFNHLLVDGGGKVVSDDRTPLSCGRTLEQVVAMVVRTAARRYFRRHLCGSEPVSRPDRPAGLLERMGLAGAAASGPMVKASTAADALYDALKERLLFEWQVPMVPTYATLTVEHALALGERLLDCDSPSKLARALGHNVMPETPAAETPTPPVPSRSPSPPSGMGRGDREVLIAHLITADGKRLNGAGFCETLLSPQVRSALKSGGVSLHPTSVLGAVGAEAARALVGGLGLRQDQLAVLLLGAYDVLGGSAFLRVFGHAALPAALERFILHAQNAHMGPDRSLEEVASFVTTIFKRRTPGPGR